MNNEKGGDKMGSGGYATLGVIGDGCDPLPNSNGDACNNDEYNNEDAETTHEYYERRYTKMTEPEGAGTTGKVSWSPRDWFMEILEIIFLEHPFITFPLIGIAVGILLGVVGMENSAIPIKYVLKCTGAGTFLGGWIGFWIYLIFDDR